MKELSTNHETARKQVWLNERGKMVDRVATLGYENPFEFANEMADLALADFDRRFPSDDYLTTTPHREFVKCPQCGVEDVSIGSGLCLDCTTRNNDNEGQHDNSPK